MEEKILDFERDWSKLAALATPGVSPEEQEYWLYAVLATVIIN